MSNRNFTPGQAISDNVQGDRIDEITVIKNKLREAGARNCQLESELRRLIDITGCFFEGTSTHETADSLLRAIARISIAALAKAEAPNE